PWCSRAFRDNPGGCGMAPARAPSRSLRPATTGQEATMQPANERDGGPAPYWRDQLIRHLDDLRTASYEGTKARAERESVFRTAVELVSGTVLAALQAVNVM